MIIVGGGVAGIAAAVRLAESGVCVRLFETRPKLGGRATSFKDVRTGETIDNCQHVAMGCCTNYLDLADRLGVAAKFDWLDESYWLERGGRESILRPGFMPAPAHFLGAFLRLKFLSIREKAELARAMSALIRCDRSGFTNITFEQWLTGRRQSKRIIDRFWDPVVVSACNLSVRRVSAAVAMHVFQEGFLSQNPASRVGVSSVPLVELYDAAEEVIRVAGGELHIGSGVESASLKSIRTTRGEEHQADRVIIATPFERALRIVDPELQDGDARFRVMNTLQHSPILGVHLMFDRPVMTRHSAVLIESQTQWLFRKDREGRTIHAVISAADEWLDLNEKQIEERVLSDVRAFVPLAREAALLSARPVKERRATYAATPEGEASRPTTTGSSGVILAGDYVQSGWPATMEGATRSGYQAAAAALDVEPDQFLIPPLSPGRILSRLGGPSFRSQSRQSKRKPATARAVADVC